MPQLLTAKPPSLGLISQYSTPDTSSSASSSLRSHASSLFDKITPTSTASFGGSPASTPLPSPVEEKAEPALEEDGCTKAIPTLEDGGRMHTFEDGGHLRVIPDMGLEIGFELEFDARGLLGVHEDGNTSGSGSGEGYLSADASAMPLIDFAPDHSVDIDAITPESMELVMRLQDMGCELDAGTLLNNISGPKGKGGLGPTADAPPLDVPVGATDDWLAFVQTIIPGFDAAASKHLLDANIPPPPAPRLQPTQLPGDVPELSLLDLSFTMENHVSDFAASLKAGLPSGPATPASILFGIQPEPVSMQVHVPAFGYSALGSGVDGISVFPGSPDPSQTTPKPDEQTPVPRVDGSVGGNGVTVPGGNLMDKLDFSIDISTPELYQVMHEGFSASKSLLDMALQLPSGPDAFSACPVRESLKMVADLGTQSSAPSMSGWDLPSPLSAAPLCPLPSVPLTLYGVPQAGIPMSYSQSSSVMITTTDNQSQIVQSSSTVSVLQHSASQTSMHHTLQSTAQLPLQMSLSQPHLAKRASPNDSTRPRGLGKAACMNNATDEFDGLVEEICELLVSEKIADNAELYLEDLTYQLEAMLREGQAGLIRQAKVVDAKERSSGRVSRRRVVRKIRGHAIPGSSMPLNPQEPPALLSSRSFSSSLFRWPTRSSSSTSLDQGVVGRSSHYSEPSSPGRGFSSNLPSKLAGSKMSAGLSRSSSGTSSGASPSALSGRGKGVLHSVIGRTHNPRHVKEGQRFRDEYNLAPKEKRVSAYFKSFLAALI